MIFDLRPMSMASLDNKQVRMIQFFSISEEIEPNDDEDKLTYNVLTVKQQHHGMESEGPVSVIIDSGADATILPSSFLDVGTNLCEGAPRLQDAQGVPIAVRGYKQVCFIFQADGEREVQIFDKAHFSDEINQPIISYGKLMEAGWNIVAGRDDGSQHCMTFGQGDSVVRIPLQLQNRSLVAEGHLRAVVEEQNEPMMVLAPSAPQLGEQRGGLQTPPALVDQPGERGAGGDIPMVFEPLPWEKEASEAPPEGRTLKKLPPPAVKAEPEAKRARIDEPSKTSSSSQHQEMVERRVEKVCVGDDTMYHLDEVLDVETMAIEEEVDDLEDLEPGTIPEELWSDHPLTRTPPEPDLEVDLLANKVEEKRLMRMSVLEPLTMDDAHLDRLTTRFVHDWRVKNYVQADGESRKRWLRRARLVAREYANDRCDEVYSPASGQHVLRLLPALFLNNVVMSQGLGDQGPPILGALDIKDAFLQVPQERPLPITTATGYYKVLKNIPGQRIGAKAWYEFLREYLEKELSFTFDVVNPCLGKQGTGSSLVCVLVHVDDVMFTGRQIPVENFVKKLKDKFDVEVSMIKEHNEEFSFLKRKYTYVAEGLLVRPGQYAMKMIKAFEDKYGPVRKQRLPATTEIQDADGSNVVPQEDAAIYRSIVGMGIYLAQERLDISFVVKELASKMSSPTELSMQKARRLVGYSLRLKVNTSCFHCRSKEKAYMDIAMRYGCWRHSRMLIGVVIEPQDEAHPHPFMV